MNQATASTAWASRLPDGAVSVEGGGDSVILRASHSLRSRFETPLERKKSATLSPDEAREYEAICHLDDALSWLNRLARRAS